MTAPETRPFSRRLARHRTLLLSAAVAGAATLAGAAGFAWLTDWRFVQSTNNAYVQGEITPISARVSGYVTAVAVTDNAAVAADQVLARIDDREYRNRVEAKRAELARIQAEAEAHGDRVTLQVHVLEEAAADVAIARAERDRSQADLGRSAELRRSGNTTGQKHDSAAADSAKAQGALARALAREAAARTQQSMLTAEGKRIEAEKARIAAELAQLEIDLEDTVIRAPIAGVIGNRAVRVGQLVEPGRFLMAVVPLDRVWIVANFKETQLARMAPGQRVRIEVDTFRGRSIEGVVESLSPASGAEFSLIPPQNASGNFNKIVQRIPVRIAITDAAALDGALRPGMSSVVHVDTHRLPAPQTAQAAAQGS